MRIFWWSISTLILTIIFYACQMGSSTKGQNYEVKKQKDSLGHTYQYVTNDPYNARVYELENGLKIYLTVDQEEPRVSTQIAVRGGSASEQRETTGLAHYLEHMLFKGTDKLGTLNWKKEKQYLERISELYEKRRGTKDSARRMQLYKKIDSLSQEAAQYAIPNEYDKTIGSMGGERTNAYTSKDQTVYLNNIPANELEKWIRLERERFSNMVLRLFHTELETVFEEFNRTQDSDYRKASYTMNKALYKGHPYQLSTIGKPEHLKNPSMKNVHKFKDTYYNPNNMAICLSGDIDPAQTVEWIKKYWGDMEAKDNIPENKDYGKAEPIDSPIIKEVQGPEAARVYFGFRFPADDSVAKRVELISKLLYNGDAGLIDLNLIKKQKVLKASCFTSSYNDYGALRFYGQARPDQSLEEVRDLLLKEVEKIKKGQFSDTMMQAILRNMKKDRINRRSYNWWKSSMFVNSFVRHKPWQEHVDYLQELEEISKEDLVQFARDNFKDNYVLVYKRNGPDTSTTTISKPPITPIDINRDKKSAFRKKIENMESSRIDPVFVDYKKRINEKTTPSGLKMKYIKNKKNKLFDLYYVLEMGKKHDKQLGLAMKYLKKLGTQQYSAEALEKKIYELALDFDVTTRGEYAYVKIDGIPETFEQGVQLLEHVLNNVEADKETYQKMVDNIIQERQNHMKRKFFIRFALSHYGQYGKNSLFSDNLSEQQLRNIDPQQLVDKIRNLYDKKHHIFYYGQHNPDSVKNAVEQYHETPDNFESLPPRKKYTQRETSGDTVFFVDYDMVQAHVTLIGRSVPQDTSLFPLAELFNEFYGSGLSSVMFQEIRESKGMAYSTYSRFTMPDTSKSHFFTAYAGTQYDKAFNTLDIMKELLNGMVGGQDQFKSAKENILKSIETERITGTSIYWRYKSLKKEGFDYDKRRMIYNKVQDLTFEDMKQFFEKYIKQNNYDILVMGNRNKLDMDLLHELGQVKEVEREELFGYSNLSQ